MADTYGRGPNGEMLYAPSSYDQWGVYMGNRAPLRSQSNVSTPSGFNAWTSDLPFEQWLPEYAKTQLARGRGSLGPEVTAPQGTPEYRQQVAARQEAAQWIIDRGGTVGDMGIRPAKGAGLNLWNQYADAKGGTYGDRFRAMALNAYNTRRHPGDAAAPTTGGTGFGGSTQGGSFTPGQAAPVQPAAAPTSTRAMAPMPTANPVVAPAGGLGGGPSNPYLTTPRGGRRGLRGLLG